jgi:hypothetical protein
MPTAATSPPAKPRNIILDAKTVAAMVRIYCRDVHRQPAGHLCDPCAALLTYADVRLERCPFGPRKTTCRECPIHCYRPAERAAMKGVMRHAGPKMLWRHPWLAARHLWLERKGPPPWPPQAARRLAARVVERGMTSSRAASRGHGFFPDAAEYSRCDRGAPAASRPDDTGRPAETGQGNCTTVDAHGNPSPSA